MQIRFWLPSDAELFRQFHASLAEEKGRSPRDFSGYNTTAPPPVRLRQFAKAYDHPWQY